MAMPAAATDSDSADASPIEIIPQRRLNRAVAIGLVGRAAGRCEFRGCNKDLTEHPLTGESGNFAENAHIVAFRYRGPRGEGDKHPHDINGIDNVMLLCAPCHKLVDDNPAKYTRAELEKQKQEHETRIRRVTALGPSMQTTVLQLKVQIGANVVDVSPVEIFQALYPRFPAERVPHLIDLTDLGEERGGAFYELAIERIHQEVARIYAAGSELERTKHLSVFGLAPIPLLMVLGNQLTNKVPVDFFQCHRDREDRWTWHTAGRPAAYAVGRVQTGSNSSKVAVMLSLSGTIAASTIPAEIDSEFSIYEITLRDQTPNPGFLRQRRDLEGFRACYRAFLAELRRDHPALPAVHMFPAIPAPVAMVCGFDLLPKIDPTLVVYDNVKKESGFAYRLKVNDHERQ